MLKELKNILNRELITTVFQPILNVKNQTVIGYEALTRGPKNSLLYSPEVLFELATEHNLLSELELLCRAKAITKFAELKPDIDQSKIKKIYLNIALFNH